MCQNRTTYIPGIERNKDASVLPQGPSLCLNDSVAPLPPVASAKQDQRMNGRLFSQHALLRKMKPCAGCGDTSTGLFQHPLHWEQWTQQAEKKSDIYCQRLPHKELKRDRGRGGRGRVGLKDKGSLFADGDEWVDHNTFRGRPLQPQRGLLKWHDWQLTPPAPALRLNILLGGHVIIIAHYRYWKKPVKDCLKASAFFQRFNGIWNSLPPHLSNVGIWEADSDKSIWFPKWFHENM